MTMAAPTHLRESRAKKRKSINAPAEQFLLLHFCGGLRACCRLVCVPMLFNLPFGVGLGEKGEGRQISTPEDISLRLYGQKVVKSKNRCWDFRLNVHEMSSGLKGICSVRLVGADFEGGKFSCGCSQGAIDGDCCLHRLLITTGMDCEMETMITQIC